MQGDGNERDTFQAAGHKFHVPGFSGFTPIQQATLIAFTELTLESYSKYGVGNAPNTTQVLKHIIDSGMTGMKSTKSRAYVYRAIKFLREQGLLAHRDDIGPHPCHWPTVLEVRPAAKYLLEK
jgi:hypothetical protein